MDITKTGSFIAELRREQSLTQRKLAEIIGVTDKAVSKWERGLSYPDIVILPKLAEVLGVSEGEILRGERRSENAEPQEVSEAMDYARGEISRNKKTVIRIVMIAVGFLAALAVIICSVCDVGLGGGGWSLYTSLSISLGTAVALGALSGIEKGSPVRSALESLSVLIIPYLIAMQLVSHAPVAKIGVPCAVLALAYLWASYFISKKFRDRKGTMLGIIFALTIPLDLLINLTVYLLVAEPDHEFIWDVISCVVLAIASACCFLSQKSEYKGGRREK